MPREAAQLRAQGIENGLRRRETQGPEKGFEVDRSVVVALPKLTGDETGRAVGCKRKRSIFEGMADLTMVTTRATPVLQPGEPGPPENEE